jgi:chromosome segregation ATPase
VLKFQKKNMDEFKTSDKTDLTMITTRTFDNIIGQIQKSNLNFQLQISPFSAIISLKKSLVKDKSGSLLLPPDSQRSLQDSTGVELATLVAKNNMLEHDMIILRNSNLNLKDDLEEAAVENEQYFNRIRNLEDQLKKERENKQKVEAEAVANQVKKLNSLSDAKRALEIKHEKVCADNKALKQDKEDQAKEINKLKVALKSSEKEVKNITYQFDKKVATLEEKMKDLNDFKSSKLIEEKDLKAKVKKYDKKLKIIQDKEAQLAIAKKEFVKKEALSCDGYDSEPKEGTVITDENLNQVEDNLETHRLKTTSIDPTSMETTMKLTTKTSAITSLELTKSEPSSCELKELLREMEKQTQDLGRKMDDWINK